VHHDKNSLPQGEALSESEAFELGDPVTVDSVLGHVIGYPAAPFVKVRHLDGQVAHYARGRIRRGHLVQGETEELD
jgi:hypothetical protein